MSPMTSTTFISFYIFMYHGLKSHLKQVTELNLLLGFELESVHDVMVMVVVNGYSDTSSHARPS